MAESMTVADFEVANRWCIHPMEGWDANRDGSPSEHTLRRWRNFGHSGAKLIWGGEAAAVRPDGRANPNQTLATQSNRAGLAALLRELNDAHRAAFGSLDGLLVGLQLTHSGRFCKPDDHHRSAPRIAYHHPLLDAKFKIDPNDDSVVWTDAELDRLVERLRRRRPARARSRLPVRRCESLSRLSAARVSQRTPSPRPVSAATWPAARACCSRSSIASTTKIPQLAVGVRLSVFDSVPYATSRDVGRPMDYHNLLPYEYGFGVAAERSAHHRSHRAARIDANAGCPWRGGDQSHLRQPILQSAPTASSHLSADRRLSAARRSARWRVATNRYRASVQSRAAGRAARRHRLQLFARLPATRRPSSRSRRL